MHGSHRPGRPPRRSAVPDVGVEAPLRRASMACRLWRCSAGRVQGFTACPSSSPLRSKPPLGRRIARSGRCPGLGLRHRPHPVLAALGCGLRAVPGHRPFPRAFHASRRLRKQMFNHSGTCRRKAQPCTRIQLPAPPRAMRAARIVLAIRQPRAFPPYPPRTHPKQVGVVPNPPAPLRRAGTAWTCGRS